MQKIDEHSTAVVDAGWLTDFRFDYRTKSWLREEPYLIVYAAW